ncbi:MAG: ATP-binding protein [Candidatus Bilamarchaeaceae archaeon]
MYLEREELSKLPRLLSRKEALVLIGPRRAGKTTIALEAVERWKKDGKPAFYMDLESIGAPSTPQDILGWAAKAPRGSLVVLDEVQSVGGWIKAARGIIEKGDVFLLMTGSSASLLSKEIASSLGGRAMPETILPLSFRDAKRWGIASLPDYMRIGGYPECVLRPNDAARLHKLYLELTVLRDVAARHGVREIKPLSDLAVLLLSEPGKNISAKKTSDMLGISQPTFRSFVQAFNDAFLILSVPPYLRSPRERLVADAKHYAYDLGMQKSVSLSSEDDSGRRLENAVALELVRRGYSLSFMRFDDCECDFIAQKIGAENLAVQVWSGEGEIPEREFTGLRKAMAQTKSSGLLLSLGESESKPADFKLKNVEDWLLEVL